MDWKRIFYVAAGVTASVLLVRVSFGLPWLLPTLITATVAISAGMLLDLVLRPGRSNVGHAREKSNV
jgi:uncharacterized membrane protein YccC